MCEFFFFFRRLGALGRGDSLPRPVSDLGQHALLGDSANIVSVERGSFGGMGMHTEGGLG